MTKKNKRAFITGVTGQDGSYLAEFLLEKGYEVYGMVRRNSKPSFGNVAHLKNQIHFVYGDLADMACIQMHLRAIKPEEIYNLGSQSHVGESWCQPLATADQTGMGALRIFETVRHFLPKSKVYQASTSELYGETKQVPQDENTPIVPENPYAAAKALAHFDAKIYRHSFGLFISTGILFNHESPRRSPDFVTRKVTLGVAAIKLGLRAKDIPIGDAGAKIINAQGKLELGNMSAKRDWGFAGDYAEAMWLMLQHKEADDFVVATGEIHTIEELCEEAFSIAGLNWRDHVIVNKNLIRPTETGPLVGNPAKIKKVLGWEPKVKFKQLIKMMVESDMELLSKVLQ